MIRLSVTDIDSFRYWKDSDMEFAEFIERMRGKFEPTPEMLAGRAFHSFMEKASEGNFTAVEQDGYTFRFAIDQDIGLPQTRELKAETLLVTPSGPVTLVGKIDAMNGLTVHDYKLTDRFDAERYADSYQWRCYLMMFDASHFIYDVFQAKYEMHFISIYDYHRLAMHAYPGMQQDVLREVSALAEIVNQYVPEKCAA